ncbi:hypothetical protein Tco_1231968, partial [Tanacetum coccineum]
LEKNPSDGVETPNEEETRRCITERKKDAAKRDKARSKSRPPKPLQDEDDSGDNIDERVTTLEAYVIKMEEQMESLHEAVKMTTQECGSNRSSKSLSPKSWPRFQERKRKDVSRSIKR